MNNIFLDSLVRIENPAIWDNLSLSKPHDTSYACDKILNTNLATNIGIKQDFLYIN